MDDELEDKLLYQTYLSHLKLMSKFILGTSSNMPLGHFLRILRSYAFKTEVLIGALLFFIMLFYLQAVDIWSRVLLGKIHYTLGRTTSKVSKLHLLYNKTSENLANWKLEKDYTAVYAVQGHRPSMEDRFVVNERIGDSDVSLFAIFDGHGGEFAADYARDKLIPNLNKRIIELQDVIAGKISVEAINNRDNDNNSKTNDDKKGSSASNSNPKKELRKTLSTSLTDDCMKKHVGVTDPELLNKIESISRPITREVRPCKPVDPPQKVDVSSYIDGKKINYSKLLTDEVLAVDRLLVEAAKKNMDVAGTTALIAIIENDKLIVANVGDSRGVMCDGKGTAIPLSFDHKPQQQREKTRINKAGGLVTFNGVWRVAGILATSRALGDYPLKDKKLVIAEPDILTFDLKDHNPSFLVLATDGLWDTFSNEEAVSFIKEHIDEPFFGAKSITLQSYYRGSLDNITVLVVNMRSRNTKMATKSN